MVNRGKPSRDCLPCRKRKLRCDLQPDGCGQCRRASIHCFGYRDPHAIIVRDETQSTRQKVLASHGLAVPRLTELQPTLDAQARVVFFSLCVFGPCQHDVVASLHEQVASGSHLVESVDAVSLAFMAHHQRQPAFATAASKKYLLAVRQMNQALQFPQIAVGDDILQTVLLLDLYEKLLNCSLASAAWMAHVNGALALIQARGRRNLGTETARRLAKRLVVTLVISCAATSVRVPEALRELCRGLDRFSEITDVKWRITGLVMSFIDLKADIREGKYLTDAEVLMNAQRVEEEFAAMQIKLAPIWWPIRVQIESKEPLVLAGHYELYQDHLTTQGANVFRTMRMLLHSVIQEYAARVPQVDQSIVEASQKIVDDAAQEICASAPQFMLVKARPGNALPFSPLQIMQCYALLPPLYLAAKLSGDPGLLPWVLETMKYISKVGELGMAQRVAEVLEKTPGLSYWSIYAMLGSYAFAA